jgi:hypothetical protein
MSPCFFYFLIVIEIASNTFSLIVIVFELILTLSDVTTAALKVH